MPHFRTSWEEDSYMKHLYNYMEQRETLEEQQEIVEEERIRDLYAAVLREMVAKHGPVRTRRGMLAKDGWETVV